MAQLNVIMQYPLTSQNRALSLKRHSRPELNVNVRNYHQACLNMCTKAEIFVSIFKFVLCQNTTTNVAEA